MRFTVLYSAIMAAGALAAPGASSSPDKVDYIANAIAKGIDLEGPIPSDAVLVKDGHYTAKEGTKAWDWIRAQIERQPEDTTNIEKRDEWANIGIGMFTQDWCKGEAAWFDNVRYFIHHYGNGQYFSVGISYRGMRDNEHLDFSKLQGNDFCGQYVYSAGHNTGVGCFNSQNINCFELRHD